MVRFETSDEVLQTIMDAAEDRCKGNIRDFDGDRVLVEGGGYEKIWLETQPMGGRMYADRDMEVALNNQLMFMRHRRKDGRLPGSIALIDGAVVPQYNKLQGFCFADEALDMYYLMGKDSDYLDELYDTLRGFDEYLWRYRDSDGDGCLETFCRYDTGEDNAVRYGDAPDAWESDIPPCDRQYVPIASMDVMSYSYSCRYNMSLIAAIRGDVKDSDRLKAMAAEVAGKLKDYLWDAGRHALFDRDRTHRRMPVLIHNNLRCMYWGSMSREMAEDFTDNNLLVPSKFWTALPLPSVAADDPLFLPLSDNNWSGQTQALTYQRAVRALERYGYINLIPELGNRFFKAIGRECAFVQQFDPFTGTPSWNKESDPIPAYGPAMLAVMEYCRCMYGIRLDRDRLLWGAAEGRETVYRLEYAGVSYSIENVGEEAVAKMEDREIFRVKRGGRVITDMKGTVTGVYPFDRRITDKRDTGGIDL